MVDVFHNMVLIHGFFVVHGVGGEVSPCQIYQEKVICVTEILLISGSSVTGSLMRIFSSG